MAVFEAFVRNSRRGLRQPQIADASGVPRMTVRRIVKRLEQDGIIVNMGKAPGSKALVYRINAADREVVEMGRSFMEYTIRMNKYDSAAASKARRIANNEASVHIVSTKTEYPNPTAQRNVPQRQTGTWS